MKKRFIPLLLALLLLSGCGQTQPDPSAATGAPISADFAQAESDLFTDRDQRPDFSEDSSTIITLSGDTASCNSSAVTVDGATVTITGEGTYILRGTLENGTVIVNAMPTHKLQIVLDGASITSATSAALYILEADKVFLTLAPGSENTLANGGSFADTDGNGVDAALFSKQDLTLNGTGHLTVTSPAGHGIVCKDDLVITGGSYHIDSASHGLDANDSIRIKGASLTVDAGKDGLHCENAEDTTLGFIYLSDMTATLEAEGDGISAGAFLQVQSGTIRILAGGGSENGEAHSSGGYGDFMGGGPGGMGGGGRPRATAENTAGSDSTSMKGMKAAGGLLISGGQITVDSADDALHSDTDLIINGGDLQIAAGDDGIHAESGLSVTAGTIRIRESYEGLEALHIRITGGDISIIATDDGLNAAGGTDSSGTGGRDQRFPGPGGMGDMHQGNGSITIDGGKLYIQASGDGIDANGSVTINGGETVVCGPNWGDTATLDYDTSATINGGTFLGTGAAGMAQTFSHNAQGVIAISAQGQKAGVTVTVTDGEGNLLAQWQPELDFTVLIISTPQIVSGQTYHVTVGTLEGDIQAG